MEKRGHALVAKGATFAILKLNWREYINSMMILAAASDICSGAFSIVRILVAEMDAFRKEKGIFRLHLFSRCSVALVRLLLSCLAD